MLNAGRWFRGLTLAMLLVGCGVCFGSEAEIKVDRSGRPVLMVDGNPQSLVMGLGGFSGGDQAPAWQAFQQAGLDSVMVFANLGFYQSKLGYVSPIKYMREFWRGPEDYDDTDVEKILASPLKANPQAKLFIWVGIGEYPEFGFMHPEDVIRNDKGEALIVESHFMRFDAAPPQPKSGHPERYAISFFSERYRQECAAMLRKFVRVVESGPYGKNVVGYLIGGGQDAQFYAWLPPDGHLQDQPDNWGDYSPVARRAFISWLSRRYEGQISALNQAWRCELSAFEQATPPPATDLAGVRPFHDLVTERRAYDWKRTPRLDVLSVT
jgi:hypothetical protein